MSFLKKIFGGGDGKKEYVDKQGIYFYVQCNNCGKTVRMRADKQYDLVGLADRHPRQWLYYRLRFISRPWHSDE